MALSAFSQGTLLIQPKAIFKISLISYRDKSVVGNAEEVAVDLNYIAYAT